MHTRAGPQDLGVIISCALHWSQQCTHTHTHTHTRSHTHTHNHTRAVSGLVSRLPSCGVDNTQWTHLRPHRSLTAVALDLFVTQSFNVLAPWILRPYIKFAVIQTIVVVSMIGCVSIIITLRS